MFEAIPYLGGQIVQRSRDIFQLVISPPAPREGPLQRWADTAEHVLSSLTSLLCATIVVVWGAGLLHARFPLTLRDLAFIYGNVAPELPLPMRIIVPVVIVLGAVLAFITAIYALAMIAAGIRAYRLHSLLSFVLSLSLLWRLVSAPEQISQGQIGDVLKALVGA